MRFRYLVPLCLLFAISTVHAADSDKAKGKDKKKWDVQAEHGPAKSVEFDTDEGTWMNVDVAPDGKEIAFDLLGDIYIMPISGGDA